MLPIAVIAALGAGTSAGQSAAVAGRLDALATDIESDQVLRVELFKFDRDGKRALVGAAPVSSRGPLFEWVKTSFAPRF